MRQIKLKKIIKIRKKNHYKLWHILKKKKKERSGISIPQEVVILI